MLIRDWLRGLRCLSGEKGTSRSTCAAVHTDENVGIVIVGVVVE